MNKYLEEGLIKIEYIFYKSIIYRWSIGFTKPMIDYEIPADSLHYLLAYAVWFHDWSSPDSTLSIVNKAF